MNYLRIRAIRDVQTNWKNSKVLLTKPALVAQGSKRSIDQPSHWGVFRPSSDHAIARHLSGEVAL